MKKSNQMRINDYEVCAIYDLLNEQRKTFIDHMHQGEPVYLFTPKNEIILTLYFKFQREITTRGLFNA